MYFDSEVGDVEETLDEDEDDKDGNEGGDDDNNDPAPWEGGGRGTLPRGEALELRAE